MLETIPGYDAWKTRAPETEAPELGRKLRALDLCVCGHEYQAHHGKTAHCWTCDQYDTVCHGFEIDWDVIEKDAKAEAENRAYDDAVAFEQAKYLAVR